MSCSPGGPEVFKFSQALARIDDERSRNNYGLDPADHMGGDGNGDFDAQGHVFERHGSNEAA
jgi:hypothetical protein